MQTALRPPSLPRRTVFWLTSTSADGILTMSKRIHVLINGEQFGPYPEGEFRQHLVDRKILRTDLVWREGLADWIRAEELLSKLGSPVDVPAGHTMPARAPAGGTPIALESVRAAAAAGDPAEQFHLGLMCDRGEGAPLNHVEAARWMQKAAEGGHAGAALHLSTMF